MTRAGAPPHGCVVRRVAVLADDLTGAADAAAPFALRGLRVAVALTSPPPQDVDVLALVTDTRWRSAADAAERVREAATAARVWEPDLLFVKVDSTLRGRVREDVAVALEAWGVHAAVASPAFPGQGRLVRHGALLVRGETSVPQVRTRFPDTVDVRDAESHDDLLAVAREVLADGSVAVGSGGLGRALAEVLVPQPRPPGSERPRAERPRAPVVLAVVGTTHPTTRAQTAALLDAGAQHMVLTPGVPDGADRLRRALEPGRPVVLTAALDDGIEADSAEAVSAAEALGSVVADVVRAVPGLGLVLTGGATSLAVATALGASALRVLSEAAEGLPLGDLEVGDRRVPVVTKSGGFGQQDALLRAVDALEDCS